LKEEIQKDGFNEALLDESDVLSLAKARDFLKFEDSFAFSETKSSQSHSHYLKY